jgi:hypothetical protein
MCHLMQLYKGEAMARLNYLLAVLPVTASESSSMNSAALKSVRRIIGLPKGAVNALPMAEVNFLPFSSTIIKHTLRLFFSLKLHPRQDTPAARIVAAQDAGNARKTFASRATTMLAAATAVRRYGDASSAMALWIPPRSLAQVHASVRILARGLAFSTVRRSLGTTAVSPRLTGRSRKAAADAALSPPSTPQTAHVAALHCVGLTSAAHLGTDPFATPFSAVGAGGCSGCVLAHANVPVSDLAAVARIRMGKVCLAYWPFYDFKRHPTGAAGPQPDRISRIAMAATAGPCTACEGPASSGSDRPVSVGGPFHLVCECQAPLLVNVRDTLSQAAPAIVDKLCTGLMQAQQQAGAPTVTTDKDAERVRTALAAVDWNSEDGRHVLYRLLLATPFPAVIAEAAAEAPAKEAAPRPLPLTAALGSMFDRVVLQPHCLRKVCGMWARWAAEHVTLLAKAYRDTLSPPQARAGAADDEEATPTDDAHSYADYAADDDNDDDDAVPDNTPDECDTLLGPS